MEVDDVGDSVSVGKAGGISLAKAKDGGDEEGGGSVRNWEGG